MNTLKIIIATHKKYEFPNASYYVPIQVGKTLTGLELNILSDNTQINISDKNQSYCELTALYWAWKNRFFQDVDYIGLVHYRRYFSGKGLRVKGKTIASENELSTLLKDADCLVPCKRDKYSDYLNSFDSVMQGKILHLYNMFVIKKSLFEEYCHWLFTILFELEKKIDVSTYDSYQKRVFGFIAERLFNVWLQKNNIKLKEVEVVSLEKQNIIFKVLKFVIRKLIG